MRTTAAPRSPFGPHLPLHPLPRPLPAGLIPGPRTPEPLQLANGGFAKSRAGGHGGRGGGGPEGGVGWKLGKGGLGITCATPCLAGGSSPRSCASEGRGRFWGGRYALVGSVKNANRGG
jgi:hypothetical protein